MLSILIPIYNYDVRNFISELHSQALKENIKFEIILADDVSETYFQKINSELQKLVNVKYIQLNENIGRSKIRNFLAEQALYDNFLFADCDMEITNIKFINKYLFHAKNNSVICGGITYGKKSPQNLNLFFRWYYGIYREKLSAETRNKKPYASFMTGNFFIQKDIFNRIKFNHNLTQYGHEDTLFGIELKRKGIKIKHINNPLIHKGLETTEEFISKTHKGINNLIFIQKRNNYPELFEEIKLLKIAKKIYPFCFFICFVFKISKNLILKNLKSPKPKLYLFDYYKLGYYYQILKN